MAMDESAVERLMALAEEILPYVPEYFRKYWRIDEELTELCRILRQPEETTSSTTSTNTNVGFGGHDAS